MVQQLVVTAIKTEVEDDPRAGRLVVPPTLESPGRRTAKQVAVGADRVGVRDDGAERDPLAVLGDDARDRPLPVLFDRANAASGPQLDAQFLRQSDQGFGHGARAAPGIPDPFADLHRSDPAEDGR